jgi:hypothetical protein
VAKPARRSLAASFVGTLNFYRRRLPGLLQQSSLPSTAWRVIKAGRNEFFRISADSLFALAPRGYGRTSIRFTELLQSGGIVALYVVDDDDVPWMPYAGRTDVWGVRGIALVVRMREVAAFFCAACELLMDEAGMTPERWARLMAAPDGECACDEARWWRLQHVDERESGFEVLPGSALAAMERRSRTLGPALFAPDMVMEQIERFVRGAESGEGSSALSCVPKPDTLRVPWQHHWDTSAYLDTFDISAQGV